MSGHDLTLFFLGLAVLLGASRLLGELATWLRQPAVLGEILAGILLGPTVLGAFAPDLLATLFPSSGPSNVALQGLTGLGVLLFLLVAGLEVDLSRLRRQGRVATWVSFSGIAVPFVLGFVCAWYLPGAMGRPEGGDRLIFALFLATALSISALPVIAKILMDLELFRSDLGMVILAAAIVNDFLGWMIFAVVLGMMPGRHAGMDVGTTLVLTLAFAGGMLTAGRWVLHRLLVWVQAHFAWPAGVLSMTIALALVAGAFTEWIGIHAIFGSLLVGVAVGDSSHFRERTRAILHTFVSALFAPIFFASIGLRVDFAAAFDLQLCLVMIGIACLGKVLGCGLGARLAGVAPREAWAIGFGMNARGAMEIILGLVALEAGLIDDRMLVALVIMALVTSMISGPLMEWVLSRRKPARFEEFLREFRPAPPDLDRHGVLEMLAGALSAAVARRPEQILEAVHARERMVSSDLVPGVWLATGRLAGLAAPAVAVAVSQEGFRSRVDEEPVHALVLLLSARGQEEQQIELLSDLARAFLEPQTRRAALDAKTAVEFRAWLKTRE